ncbi:hypothetical protein BDD12DRAFT_903950 [Trichophaea hybrida]|nr:hypothetical protein BDD12DRAFT_903950 [Trichophaea hybrida]
MELQQHHVLKHTVLVVSVAALSFTSAALMRQPEEQAAPSPSSYPDIASSTSPVHSGGIYMTRAKCTHFTDHTNSTLTAAGFEDGTIYWALWPNCRSTSCAYAYGLGTMVEVNCWNGTSSPHNTSLRNPSWLLNVAETDPAKRPLLVIVTSLVPTTESFTGSCDIAMVWPPQEKEINMPIGSITGITIGCIVAILIGIVVMMAFQSKFLRPSRAAILLIQTKQLDSVSPAPIFTRCEEVSSAVVISTAAVTTTRT